MSSRKLNELASDVDDAAMVVEELQAEPDVDASEKLDELKRTLEDASDALDELQDDEDEGVPFMPPGSSRARRIPRSVGR
jgi:hypothetical protein